MFTIKALTSSVCINILKSNRVSLNFAHAKSTFETILLTQPKEFVYHVELNRPDKFNAFNKKLRLELHQCFDELNKDENCRVVVLSANGKHFTGGLDFSDMGKIAGELAEKEDVARKAKLLFPLITEFQRNITSLESCNKPVLAAVHSACVGAGVDLITAADIRYCSKDAWFQVKEIDIGMAADVGTLQRLPKVIGSSSLARELCYTCRKMQSDEALSSGLVSQVFNNKDEMLKHAIEVAEVIAKKSPVAVQVTKMNLNYSRDHSVQEGLDHIATWNQMMLQSEDFAQATVAQMTKQKDVKFSNF